MRIIACALAFCLFASPASSHSWFTGKSNPKTGYGCCGGTDCQAIETTEWWLEGDRYLVTWRDGRTYSIPATQVQPTEERDGRAAACVWGGMLRCLFVPLGF